MPDGTKLEEPVSGCPGDVYRQVGRTCAEPLEPHHDERLDCFADFAHLVVRQYLGELDHDPDVGCVDRTDAELVEVDLGRLDRGVRVQVKRFLVFEEHLWDCFTQLDMPGGPYTSVVAGEAVAGCDGDDGHLALQS